MISKLLREDRLCFWDLLIQGAQVTRSEVNETVSKFVHDASSEEKASCVLLLAAAKISEESNPMRRNLVAALRYWFSNVGTRNVSPEFKALLNKPKWRDMDLLTCMGLYLNWPQAACSVGGNPRDYTALTRLQNELRRRYFHEWEKLFGSPPSITITNRG